MLQYKVLSIMNDSNIGVHRRSYSIGAQPCNFPQTRSLTSLAYYVIQFGKSLPQKPANINVKFFLLYSN